MTNVVNSIEITARSLDAAVRQALEQLGAQEHEVIIEILASPRSGLLGLGSRPARVRVTRRSHHPEGSSVEGSTSGARAPSERSAPLPSKPAAPTQTNDFDSALSGVSASAAAPESDRNAVSTPPNVASAPASVRRAGARAVAGGDRKEAQTQPSKDLNEQRQEVVNLLNEILALMGEPARIVPVNSENDAGEHAAIEINLEGQNTGLLIGRRGQTLEALEYIVNRVMARRVENAAPILLDVESYHARRNQRLVRTALALGEQVKRQHKPVRLKPMPPRERRIIHMTLRDDPLLTTESSGSGYLRAVKIMPTPAPQQTPPARSRA